MKTPVFRCANWVEAMFAIICSPFEISFSSRMDFYIFLKQWLLYHKYLDPRRTTMTMMDVRQQLWRRKAKAGNVSTVRTLRASKRWRSVTRRCGKIANSMTGSRGIPKTKLARALRTRMAVLTTIFGRRAKARVSTPLAIGTAFRISRKGTPSPA